jgi:hypothetical protein
MALVVSRAFLFPVLASNMIGHRQASMPRWDVEPGTCL